MIEPDQKLDQDEVKKVPERLYLGDIHVGQRFTSGSHTVDEDQITRFAREFDPQPFHLDHDAAKATLFEGLAASGWHTAAITMRLLVDGGAPIAGGILGVGGEISWPRPTRPGDVLQVESEVVQVAPSRSRPDRGIVTIHSETRNQRGDVVQTFVAKVIVPRRPDTSTPVTSGELHGD
jgi:acyl dehydratase